MPEPEPAAATVMHDAALPTCTSMQGLHLVMSAAVGTPDLNVNSDIVT